MINDDINVDLFLENDLSSVKKIYQYEILDTPPEKDFDTIALLAATIFGTSNAHLCFIDGTKVFLKSILCSVFKEEVLQVNHLLITNCIVKEVVLDQENAQLPDLIKFYAAAPITSPEGDILGSIAVSDTKPQHAVTAQQMEMLHMLSKVVAEKLEQRLAHLKIQEASNKHLRNIAHDIKNPVTSISLYAQLLGSREMTSEKVFSMASKIASSVKRIEENLNSLPKKLNKD